MKATIDDHIQQLFDALLQSLRHSIGTSAQTIDAFLTEAKKSLSVRPQSVEEIGEVNKKHAEIAKQKPQVSGSGMGVILTVGGDYVYKIFKNILFERKLVMYRI